MDICGDLSAQFDVDSFLRKDRAIKILKSLQEVGFGAAIRARLDIA